LPLRYHLPNAYLESHSLEDPLTGQTCALKLIKGKAAWLMNFTDTWEDGTSLRWPCSGMPETLDAVNFVADLGRLRREGGDIALPIYDRSIHDPVPAGLRVKRGHRVVLVEGLHLLHRYGAFGCEALPLPG
jgi:hypothetical protein